MPDRHWLALFAALAAVLCSGWAEYRHARRIRAVARLAFGPFGGPRAWTRCVPALRVAAGGLLAWGLVILATTEPAPLVEKSAEDGAPTSVAKWQRVVIVLDVSPSMTIADSSPTHRQPRRERVRDVMEAVFRRIALARTRLSVVAFFTSARPVAVDVTDLNVIRNVLDDLPLVWAFEPGETQLLSGIQVAAELSADWPADSTTLLVCTDGDTADLAQVPKLPRSVRSVEIIGVGDPLVGTFIGNHDSRQQLGVLRRLAAELGGAYYNANSEHVPTAALADLAQVPPRPAGVRLRWQDLALVALICGSLLLVGTALALEYLGGRWRAERELPPPRPLPRSDAGRDAHEAIVPGGAA